MKFLKHHKTISLKILLMIVSLSSRAQTTQSNVSDTTIYQVVEVPPIFPGCGVMESYDPIKRQCADDKMWAFIYNHLKYPEEAKQQWVEGVNIVEFVVEKDGSISYPIVTRDIGAGTKAEVLRLLDLMPVWIAGKKQGHPVRVRYFLPVRFKLDYSAREKR